MNVFSSLNMIALKQMTLETVYGSKYTSAEFCHFSFSSKNDLTSEMGISHGNISSTPKHAKKTNIIDVNFAS